MRQIQLQRLPSAAIIEREPYGSFRSSKQQILLNRIFANGIYRRILRQPIHDFLPALTTVVRAEDQRVKVIDTKSADTDIRCVLVKMRGADLRDFAPGRKRRRRDVLPILAGVTGDPDFPVVGSGPDRSRVMERR